MEGPTVLLLVHTLLVERACGSTYVWWSQKDLMSMFGKSRRHDNQQSQQ